MLNTLNLDLADKTARIDALTSESEENILLVNSLRQQLTEKDTEIKSLASVNDEKESMIASLQLELSEKKAQVEAFASEAADDQIASLSAEIISKEDRIRELEKAVTGQSGLIGTLSDNLTEKDRKIESLEKEIAEKNARIDSLSTAVSEQADVGVPSHPDYSSEEIELLTAKVESLSADLSNRDGQIEALKSDIIRRASENGILSGMVEEKDRELETLRADFKTLSLEQASYNSRTDQIKQWFLNTLSGSSSEAPDSSDGSEHFRTLLRFKVRDTDSPNVRREPGTQGKVIGHAPASAEFEVLDITPGLWYMIRLENGKTGWISSRMGSVTDLRFLFGSEDTP